MNRGGAGEPAPFVLNVPKNIFGWYGILIMQGGDMHNTHRKTSMGSLPTMRRKDSPHGNERNGNSQLAALLPKVQA